MNCGHNDTFRIGHEKILVELSELSNEEIFESRTQCGLSLRADGIKEKLVHGIASSGGVLERLDLLIYTTRLASLISDRTDIRHLVIWAYDQGEREASPLSRSSKALM